MHTCPSLSSHKFLGDHPKYPGLPLWTLKLLFNCHCRLNTHQAIFIASVSSLVSEILQGSLAGRLSHFLGLPQLLCPQFFQVSQMPVGHLAVLFGSSPLISISVFCQSSKPSLRQEIPAFLTGSGTLPSLLMCASRVSHFADHVFQ